MRLFSTEQVSKWHPDKMADQVSDAIVTAVLAKDKKAHVACECLLKGSTCILAGEITTTAKIDYKAVAKRTLLLLEPWKNYNVELHISEQSPEIGNAVAQDEHQGAGDQGMMYGYACSETESLLPYGFDLANRIIARLEKFTVEHPGILKGDAKTQVTVDLDTDPGEKSVKLILISVCHFESWSVEAIRKQIRNLFPEFTEEQLLINPSGSWTIGGPDADCGLTGRKIVADQYGGYCPVGGGAFSGKDPSKVDRSASYMARHIAKNLVKAYGLKDVTVQLAYAIGVAQPVSVSAKSSDGDDFSKEVMTTYDLTPKGIIEHLKMLDWDFEKLAQGCHYR